MDWNLLERVRAASERARRSEEETDNLAAKVHAAEEWRARLPVPETEE